jgi:hypothetical protein
MDQTDLNQVADTAAAISTAEIHNPDPNHQVVEMKFGFRTKKDEKTGVETKRPAVEVKLPVLSFEGIVSVLKNANTEAGKKQYELLMQAVQGTYEAAIKDFLADNENITSENFPASSQFSWEALANQPESERRGRGIAKEVWEDFIKSYITVMPGLTGKPEENIKKQAAILAQKLNPLKNHEDKEKILPNFKQALTVYINGAGQDAETFAGCVEFLMNKADALLNAEKNADLMANLGF